MDSERQKIIELHQSKKMRLKAAFDRFMAKISRIEQRRNQLAKEINEQLEQEQLEQVRHDLDEQ